MRKLRYGMIALSLLVCSITPAAAGVSIGIGLPTVSIGINLPLYPELVRVPGYPVYYAPRMDANYFFYDGMYWVYQNDNWYASSWYNGPWGMVGPEVVPLYILRVPVRYYRQPPVYFRGWQSNAPPRWGQHWGHDWERQRSGWNKWNRSSAPAPAPLPVYQRKYSGDRYPGLEQQHELRSREYRYQPRDKAVRQHLKQVAPKASAPAQQGRKPEPALRSPQQQETPRSAPHRQGALPGAQSQPPQRGGEQLRKSAPAPAMHEQKQQRAPAAQEQKPRGQEQHEQKAPLRQDRGEAQGGRGHGQHDDGDRGQGRNK